MDGGFAEFCAYPAGKVFKIHNLSDVDATLLEPASCAAHGLDKISPKLGSSVLMFGAGPTGLVLSQMLRQNGGCHVVVAAPQGLKMELAKKLGAGDVRWLPLPHSILTDIYPRFTLSYPARTQRFNSRSSRTRTHTASISSLRLLDLQRFSKMQSTTFAVEGSSVRDEKKTPSIENLY